MPFILVFNKSAVILKLCAQTDYMVLEVFFFLICFKLRNSYIEIAVAVTFIFDVTL